MANLNDDWNKIMSDAKRGTLVSFIIGGAASFSFGAYAQHLENKGILTKKQKRTLMTLSITATLCSGIVDRLNERRRLMEAIDSVEES